MYVPLGVHERNSFLYQRFPGEVLCHLFLEEQRKGGQAKGMERGWELSSEKATCTKKA